MFWVTSLLWLEILAEFSQWVAWLFSNFFFSWMIYLSLSVLNSTHAKLRSSWGGKALHRCMCVACFLAFDEMIVKNSFVGGVEKPDIHIFPNVNKAFTVIHHLCPSSHVQFRLEIPWKKCWNEHHKNWRLERTKTNKKYQSSIVISLSLRSEPH